MSSLSCLQHPYVLGDWESDSKGHKAFVVQRVRPPTKRDAELVGLKRIQESELTIFDVEPPFDEEIEKFRFMEGQGAYIREYFEAVITPLLARANEKFTATSREIYRTKSNLSYILEKIETDGVPKCILNLHNILYNALAPDSEYKDLCLDFVVVEGKMLYDITPEFFNNLLLVYRFPFGIVLLHKCRHPVVLVIVTYSMTHKLRMFGSGGAREVCSRPQRMVCAYTKEEEQERIPHGKPKCDSTGRASRVSCLSSPGNLWESIQQDTSSDLFLRKTRDSDMINQAQFQYFAT